MVQTSMEHDFWWQGEQPYCGKCNPDQPMLLFHSTHLFRMWWCENCGCIAHGEYNPEGMFFPMKHRYPAHAL